MRGSTLELLTLYRLAKFRSQQIETMLVLYYSENLRGGGGLKNVPNNRINVII